MRKHYTQGDRNRLIDSVFHPLAKKKSRCFWLADLALHSLNERSLQSLVKSARYYTPRAIDELADRWENKHSR